MIQLGYWRNQEIIYPSQTGLTNCWSLFLRVQGYTGPCIRVRRSSDNTESDIGFSHEGVIDIEALKSFVGSSTGHIRYFYDQKDNYDLEPYYFGSGTYWWPRIVISGTVQHDSTGNVSINFGGNGTDNYTALWTPAGSTRLINSFSGTVYYSHQVNSINCALGGNSNGNSLQCLLDSGSTGTSTVFWDYNSPQTYRFKSGSTISTLVGVSPDFWVTSGNTYTNFSNNTKKLISESGVGWNTLGTGHSIGGRGNGNTSFGYVGYCNEYLIYGSTVHNNTTQENILNTLSFNNFT